VIADSEKESAATCQSIVTSISPSAAVTTVSSPAALLDRMSTEKESTGKDSNGIRIAFVGCDSMDNETLASTHAKLKDNGWLTLAFSNHGGFSRLIDCSNNVYAVFRRPLPLVRMGDVFRDALNYFALSARSSSAPASSASSSAQGKVAENEVVAKKQFVDVPSPSMPRNLVSKLKMLRGCQLLSLTTTTWFQG